VRRVPRVGVGETSAVEGPEIVGREDPCLPFALEELDHRLEAALLSISEFHADEPCVWACACFLVDGSEG
jgi:hypothetical protein